MEKRKNLCAMIPEELHGRVKQEQEALALNLAQYVEMVLEEHFKKGGKEMANGTRGPVLWLPSCLPAFWRPVFSHKGRSVFLPGKYQRSVAEGWSIFDTVSGCL